MKPRHPRIRAAGDNPTPVFVNAEPWTTDAACARVNPEVMYPLPTDRIGITAAKQVCGTCPVRRECLAYATRNGERNGVWGGVLFEQPLNQRRTAAYVDDVVVEARLQGRVIRPLRPGETQEVVRRGKARGMTHGDLQRLGIKPERYVKEPA